MVPKTEYLTAFSGILFLISVILAFNTDLVTNPTAFNLVENTDFLTKPLKNWLKI